MSSFRNRRNFSSPSLETLPRRLPPPIPTGKGSRSAADPEFSEYVDITKEEQVPDLILPEHVRSNFEEPAEIDYLLLLAGDDDSVQRLLRSAADFGVFMMIGHGLCSEEVKSTLIENQWAFEKLSKSSRRRYVADHEEFVWCRKTAENAENDKNLHIFCQNMNKVAENLEQMGKELAAIMITRGGGGNIKKLSIKNKNNSIKQLRTREDCESHLIVHKYYQTTDTITDQLNIPTCSSFPIITNIGQKVISLRFYLLLEEAGEFFFSSSSSSSHAPAGKDVCFSFFARQNAIAVAVGDYFNQGRQNIVDSDEFKNAILFENLKFKPEIMKGQRDEPLFLIELQWSSSSSSSSSSSEKIKISGFNHHPSNNINPAKKFITLSDQILILLLLIILYKTFFLIIFLRF